MLSRSCPKSTADTSRCQEAIELGGRSVSADDRTDSVDKLANPILYLLQCDLACVRSGKSLLSSFRTASTSPMCAYDDHLLQDLQANKVVDPYPEVVLR